MSDPNKNDEIEPETTIDTRTGSDDLDLTNHADDDEPESTIETVTRGG